MTTTPKTNIHWLLDQIDDTAPRCCQTCVYAGTHESCDKCLTDYSNWKPGNAVMRLYEHQKAGKSVLVIGDQGEADFYATNPPTKVAAHLRRVSGACGYLTSSLLGSTNGTQTLTITTHDGKFLIQWDSGRLVDIRKSTENGYVASWPDADTLEVLNAS